ncbi:hypothetical protein IMSAG013_01258 [Clostridiales bacterium]|nr:hypothetical protein IMSAG013_01258 [Clostridiales bacterium]
MAGEPNACVYPSYVYQCTVRAAVYTKCRYRSVYCRFSCHAYWVWLEAELHAEYDAETVYA